MAATIGLSNEFLVFEKAKTFVRFNTTHFSPEHLLRFYAFDKQASLGDCTESCPKCQFSDLRQKWSAWSCLKGKSKEEAAKLYVNQLEMIVPDWRDPNREKPGCSSALYAKKTDEAMEEKGNPIEKDECSSLLNAEKIKEAKEEEGNATKKLKCSSSILTEKIEKTKQQEKEGNLKGQANDDDDRKKNDLTTFLKAVTYVKKHKETFTSEELLRYFQLYKIATNKDEDSSDEFDDNFFREDDILLWNEAGRKAQRFWEDEKGNISNENANSIKQKVSVDFMNSKIHQKQLIEVLNIANDCLKGKENPNPKKKIIPPSTDKQIALRSDFDTSTDSDSDCEWSDYLETKGLEDVPTSGLSTGITDSSSDSIYESTVESVTSSEDEYERELFANAGKMDLSTDVMEESKDADLSKTDKSGNKKEVKCDKPKVDSCDDEKRREQAMIMYVRKLSAKIPNWDGGKVTAKSKQSATESLKMDSIVKSTLAANEPSTVSGVSIPVVNDEKGKEKTIYDYVKEGDLEIVDALLVPGKINEPDEMGLTMLHWAADRGNFDIMMLLLFHNADVNAKDREGQTPLHYASSCGHRDIVKILLAHNTDLFAKNKEGLTATDMAANRKIYKDLTNPDTLFVYKLNKLKAEQEKNK